MALEKNIQDNFSQGELYSAYKYFGAHVKGNGVLFRVWGGSAQQISVIGDFNSWNQYENPMKYIENGIWELYIEGLNPGSLYKFAVLGKNGKWVNKSDPFAFYSEYRPGTASIIYDINLINKKNSFVFDKHYEKPLNIYEIHLY